MFGPRRIVDSELGLWGYSYMRSTLPLVNAGLIYSRYVKQVFVHRPSSTGFNSDSDIDE